MKTIWKYQLTPTDEVTVMMPIGARVLSVGAQHGLACIWALVDSDPAAVIEKRRFSIRGTGHPMNGAESGTFVGTFQMLDGALVWHLFDHGGE